MLEPRSFLPAVQEERHDPVKFEPITSARPTNREIVRSVESVHTCVEHNRVTADRQFREIKADVREIKDALKIGDKGKPAGLSSQRGAFFRTVGATLASMGGVVILWKMLAIFLPGLAIAFELLNKAINSGKI
jgi:hypothetical protein